MRLKDRINHDRNYGRNNADQKNKLRRDNCWKFNMGKCTYGLSCKYEHRCALCLKFGHGAHNCRKVRGGSSSASNFFEERKRKNYDRNNRNDRYHFYRGDRDRDRDSHRDRGNDRDREGKDRDK